MTQAREGLVGGSSWPTSRFRAGFVRWMFIVSFEVSCEIDKKNGILYIKQPYFLFTSSICEQESSHSNPEQPYGIGVKRKIVTIVKCVVPNSA